MWATRFDCSGDLEDLQESLSHYEAANAHVGAHEIPGDDAPISHNTPDLREDFLGSGNVEDLDSSINVLRETVVGIVEGSDDEYHSTVLNSLGSALELRFEQTGQQGDLDEAVLVHKQALQLLLPIHPMRSNYLLDFAAILLARFKFFRVKAPISLAPF